jgi:hypothetical protein
MLWKSRRGDGPPDPRLVVWTDTQRWCRRFPRTYASTFLPTESGRLARGTRTARDEPPRAPGQPPDYASPEVTVHDRAARRRHPTVAVHRSAEPGRSGVEQHRVEARRGCPRPGGSRPRPAAPASRSTGTPMAAIEQRPASQRLAATECALITLSRARPLAARTRNRPGRPAATTRRRRRHRVPTHVGSHPWWNTRIDPRRPGRGGTDGRRRGEGGHRAARGGGRPGGHDPRGGDVAGRRGACRRATRWAWRAWPASWRQADAGSGTAVPSDRAARRDGRPDAGRVRCRDRGDGTHRRPDRWRWRR